jgi:4-amino-4-deoxy-L-arabinose transferase-like glycosyltransferase
LILYSDCCLGGARFELKTTYIWNDEPYPRKRARGEVPRRRLLHAGRAITAIYGSLCVLLVFAAGKLWFDARTGLLAALLLLGTPAFVVSTTRVMTDIYYNLFLLAGCVAISLTVRSSSKRRDLLLAAACGMLGGLASAVKITGFLLVGAVYAVVHIFREIRERGPVGPVAQRLTVFTATALACIYALNPFYWPELDKIEPRELSREIRQIASGDVGVEFSNPLLTQLGSIIYGRREIIAAFPQTYNIARPLEFPVQFMRWKRLWEKQEKLIPWPDSRFPVSMKKMAIELTAFPFEWIFLLCGVVYCARSTHLGWKAGQVSPRVVVLVWLGLIVAGVLAAAPRPEDRFFLPGVIATRILVAAGIVWSFDQARKWLLARRSHSFRALS